MLFIPDLAALDRLGRLMAEELPPGTLVALNGTLGAGKTRLVQAVAAACEVTGEEVISPTFVLCREYHGRRMIYHADAYRIRDEDEFLALGAEEWFQSTALTFLEWAERVERCLPPDHIRIDIAIAGETSREIHLAAVGSHYQDVVQRIAMRYAAS